MHQPKTHTLKLFNQNFHPQKIEIKQHDFLQIQVIDLKKEINTGIYQKRYVFLEIEDLEVYSGKLFEGDNFFIQIEKEG
jgi:hypothetical protein